MKDKESIVIQKYCVLLLGTCADTMVSLTMSTE